VFSKFHQGNEAQGKRQKLIGPRTTFASCGRFWQQRSYYGQPE
jgi:hypothetical protein